MQSIFRWARSLCGAACPEVRNRHDVFAPPRHDLLLFGGTGRWPVVRGSLPRTDAVCARRRWSHLVCALRKIAFGATAECYRLAACAPQRFRARRRAMRISAFPPSQRSEVHRRRGSTKRATGGRGCFRMERSRGAAVSKPPATKRALRNAPFLDLGHANLPVMGVRESMSVECIIRRVLLPSSIAPAFNAGKSIPNRCESRWGRNNRSSTKRVVSSVPVGTQPL